MNEKFREHLETAITEQIPQFLEILKQHYEQIPKHLKGDFNRLKGEFRSPPNNFSLGDWKSRLSTLIMDFGFEIVGEVNKEILKEDNLWKGQRIINTQNYFENIALHFLEQMNEKGEINLKKLIGNEMIPVYLNNIAKNPKDADSYFELGFIYNELENYEQAEKYMSNVVSIDPDFHEAWVNLGNLYASHFKEDGKAKECFEKALSIRPDDESAIYDLGCLYSVQKKK